MDELDNKNSGDTVPILSVSDFARASALVLARIEQGCVDADIDADFVSDGVLEIEFDTGGQIVVNRHEVSREIWVAGQTGAYHFRWNGSGWQDTRSGDELYAVVTRLVSQIAGRTIDLS